MNTPGRKLKRHLPRPSISLAERLVSDLKATLPPKVNAAPEGIPPEFPFKVLSLREPLLCRIVDLVEASLELCKADKGMGAAILARAVLEATAVLFALVEGVEGIAKGKDVGDFEQRLNAMLVGSKNQKTPVDAINILTHIKKMDKTFEGILEHYGLLSELAHPNFAGVLNSYARLGPGKFDLILGRRRTRLKSVIGQVVVPTLCYCLIASGRFSDRVSAVLSAFFLMHLRANGRISEERA
jgi:hypothetical protein